MEVTPADTQKTVSPSLQGPADHRAPFFALEPLTHALIEELTPLTEKHYLEVAHYHDIPLDPDWPTYLKVQENGLLRVYTARDERGALIGYNFFFVKYALHYRGSLQAGNDIIFIDPVNRGFGKHFIAWCDEQLRNEGVQVVFHHVKAAHDWSPMLEKMGYEFQDKIMTRRLDR